jgi:NAD+ synthetase
VQNIETVVEAYRTTNPEAFQTNFDKGNLMSRIRANILSTKAATEKKTLLGTGNKDEDFGIGYYTLFGDGAVHMSPIGALPKRLVREMARYLGFRDLADRIPTAGLEPGQTDFKDLGYGYDLVEIVTEGYAQGIQKNQLMAHSQVAPLARAQMQQYETLYGVTKFQCVDDMVNDILRRHERVALPKAQIVHPPIAPVTLRYV